MSRFATRFAQLRERRRTALIPYLTAGDPAPNTTVPLLHTLVAHGADALEVGVPFSDPMADGPVIQAACERALKHGMRLSDVLDMVAEFRHNDAETPLALMGYCNPIVAMGTEVFAKRASSVGVDGVLIVDLPPEEAASIVEPLRTRDVDPIFLLAPTTTDTRLQLIVAQAQGFLYYVSLRGTTGASLTNFQEIEQSVARIRAASSLPIGIGFGIRDADSAAQAAQCADAVIVGSALVEQIQRDPNAVGAFVQKLRDSIDQQDASNTEPMS